MRVEERNIPLFLFSIEFPDRIWYVVGIGFASLKVVSPIAEGVATAAINQQLEFSE